MGNDAASKYHKDLFNHFGYNFGFVADLLDKYLEDRDSVSDYWQTYFDDLTSGDGKAPKQKQDSPEKKRPSRRKAEIKRPQISDSFEIAKDDEIQPITGVGERIIENMENSLSIPIATSLRAISVKLLEENRKIINHHLKRLNRGKLSFTHLVAYAIITALKDYPNINNAFAFVDDKPSKVIKPYINFGLAVDTTRKDGTRSLIVPNIKKAGDMNFQEFVNAYNDLISRVKSGRIEPGDFQNTTVTLTNPGGIGTVSSNPRLMTGQGAIIAIGAIDYPAEFKAMHESALAAFGVGKVMNITSTYDHRIIQGAESGEFLKEIDNLLLGNKNFYETLFEDLQIPQKPVDWGIDTSTKRQGYIKDRELVEKQANIFQLINIYRVRGHLIANLNPLSHSASYHEELDPKNYDLTVWDYDRYFMGGNLKGVDVATLREILDILHQTYCERIGVEYMHIQHPDEKTWLQNKMEPIRNKPSIPEERRKRIMEKLIVAEGFEHFLHTRFIGHKRFSLEGNETLIPLLDQLLGMAANENMEEAILGMAHRGRLNVLSNIIGKSLENIFSEFEEDIDPDSPQGTGDVKYHLGASGTYETFNGRKIGVTISPNPSHLEWVNPVVEGIARAKYTRKKDREFNSLLPVLIHGDAAFAGQGIVSETLNLSQLKGYRTGGTVHIVVNNQIGFTTPPEEARSSPYATDVAKMVQAPIFHVNGDDPEASLWVTQLAFEYRQKFNKDVVIDLFGYRRHGHNEGDDPVYTQPLMYKKIKEHPSVKEIYQKTLTEDGIFSEEEIKKLDDSIRDRLDKAYEHSKKKRLEFKPDRPLAISHEEYKEATEKKWETKVSFEDLSEVVKGITTFPEDFSLNPKLKKHIAKRREFLTGHSRIDWAFAEALAFGSLLVEGVPVRLSGQDSVRGTFSQRHLVMTDMVNGTEINPHNSLKEGQARLEALDSLLSEAAIVGFEFGYSVADPLALVLWEAQFGDFANGAQIIIDNFISAAGKKWELPSNLVMLLPHGQEGQGPEHSSARLERFLTLCAENNMQVCNPTTPAQYFHLLRRQICDRQEKPLIVMTPKSLLRLPAARSPINEFTEGEFRILIEEEIENKDNIERVILTSGKVYYDLIKYRDLEKIENTAIVRMEQYYPYYGDKVKEILASYKKAKKVAWVQEEPKNMGAWSFLMPRLWEDLAKHQELVYVGRDESPSPASGSSKIYRQQQDKLVKDAFEK